MKTTFTNNHSTAAWRAIIVMAAKSKEGRKIDLKKDFFELDNEELSVIRRFKKIFNFSGKNNLGRSELRQFYYHLQKGYEELPF